MPKPTIDPYIGLPVLFNDGGDVPIPGLVVRVNDNSTVNLSLFREKDGVVGTVESIAYGDGVNQWSEVQPF